MFQKKKKKKPAFRYLPVEFLKPNLQLIIFDYIRYKGLSKSQLQLSESGIFQFDHSLNNGVYLHI